MTAILISEDGRHARRSAEDTVMIRIRHMRPSRLQSYDKPEPCEGSAVWTVAGWLGFAAYWAALFLSMQG